MTDAIETNEPEDAARRERIQPLLDYWIERLFIHDFDISWMFVKPAVLNSDDGRAIAQVTFTQPYHKAFIRFDRQMVDGCSDAELERCVIHELCHTLTYPYREVYHDYCNSPFGQDLLGADETVADMLANVFYHYRHPEASMAPYESLMEDDTDCQECHPEGEDDEDGTD